MRKLITAIFLAVLVLLFSTSSIYAKNYAVLISAGEATADDARENSEYWYDLFLMYSTLIDEGYSHEDIYVLYGEGNDFQSSHERYQNPYPINQITDLNNHESTIENLFISLGNNMTNEDIIYVWWMGHGDSVWWFGWHVRFYIQNTHEWVRDTELANYVDQIQNYRAKAFSFMTCFSGGIIDDLEGLNSIVLTSSTFDQTSESDILCDTWHAEFNYFEACAFHWITPFDLCGRVSADLNHNSRISFEESFIYDLGGVVLSDPQKSDYSGIAPTTYLSQPGVGYYSYNIDDDTLGTSSGDGNGIIDPGESIELPVTVMNYGYQTAYGVEAIIRKKDVNDIFVSITDSIEFYGEIGSFATKTSSDDYDFTVAANCTTGHIILLELIAKDASNHHWTSNFNLPVGGCKYIENYIADMYLYKRWQWGGPNQYTEEFTIGVRDGEGTTLPVYPYQDRIWFLLDREGIIWDYPGKPGIYYYGLIVCYNAVSRDTEYTVLIPDSWSDNHGLAYDDRDGSFWYTVWDESRLYHIDGDGNLIGSYDIGQYQITGLAFDADDNHLWGIINGPPDKLIEYNVSSGIPMLIQGPFPVPWSSPLNYSAAGLEYDEARNMLIAVNYNTDELVYFRDVIPNYQRGAIFDKYGVCLIGSSPLCYTPEPWGVGLVTRTGTAFLSSHRSIRPLPLDKYSSPCLPTGDVNADCVVNASDVVYLINYLFIGGPAPDPIKVADINLDGAVNSADAVYLINYLFIGGPPPCCY